jgi:hypothetical protein
MDGWHCKRDVGRDNEVFVDGEMKGKGFGRHAVRCSCIEGGDSRKNVIYAEVGV